MNPFDERTPFKKRIVNASLTEEQHEAFLRLQAEMEMPSAGALIKRLLRDEINRREEQK